jgi:hypothetical protein
VYLRLLKLNWLCYRENWIKFCLHPQGWCAVSTGEQLPVLRKIVVSSSSGSRGPTIFRNVGKCHRQNVAFQKTWIYNNSALKTSNLLSLQLIMHSTLDATETACPPARPPACLSVRPSAPVEQLGSHWTDFYEIWYLGVCRKSFEKFRVLFKCDRNDRCFIWSTMYIYDNISLRSSYNKKCFRKKL